MSPPTGPAEPPTEVVTLLIGDDRIERCPPDRPYAAQVLETLLSDEVEDMLHASAQGRWRKANTYAYDGARKAVEAWLLMFGWRVRAAPGAHAAVGEIVDRWLSNRSSPGPRIARAFSAARKARHDDEYPSPTAPNRTDRELRALTLDSARLINEVRAVAGLEPADRIVPTDEVLGPRRGG